MSFTPFKEVSIGNPGTASKYGADQLLEIMQIFNNKTVASRRVQIKNPWQFMDHVELVAPASLPGSPTSANTRFIVVDPADNHLKIMKTGGSMIDIDSVVANTWNASASETLSNKTISSDLNTVNHSTTNSLGELFKNTGTKFDRFAKGAALTLLRVNSAGTDLEWASPGVITGGGEANTASNVGTAGTGLFKQKTGVNLEFKKIHAASGNISVVDNVGASQVDLDVNLAGITLGSLAGQVSLTSQVTGTLGVPNGGTGGTSFTGLLRGNGTSAISGIANGTAGQIMTMSGGNPTWVTPAAGSNTAFYPDATKWGGFWGGATSGTGIFSGVSVYGDAITGDQSSATDSFTTFTTNNSDAEIAGWNTLVTCTRRDYNPILNFRFKIGNTANSHVWIGMQSAGTMGINASADDPLDGISGLLFGFSDVHTNFQVTYNAGGAGGAFIDTGTAKNTSTHDLQLEFDNVAGKIKATFDGSVKTPAGTTDTPATTTPMFVFFSIEAVGTNAVPISQNYAKIVQNE